MESGEGLPYVVPCHLLVLFRFKIHTVYNIILVHRISVAFRLLDGWGIGMSGVNNEKLVIDFRSPQVRQALLCIHYMVVKNEIVKLKNVVHCICNHSIGLIICYRPFRKP